MSFVPFVPFPFYQGRRIGTGSSHHLVRFHPCESVLGTVQVQQQLGLVFDSSNHRAFSRHDPVSRMQLPEDQEGGEERFWD